MEIHCAFCSSDKWSSSLATVLFTQSAATSSTSPLSPATSIVFRPDSSRGAAGPVGSTDSRALPVLSTSWLASLNTMVAAGPVGESWKGAGVSPAIRAPYTPPSIPRKAILPPVSTTPSKVPIDCSEISPFLASSVTAHSWNSSANSSVAPSAETLAQL